MTASHYTAVTRDGCGVVVVGRPVFVGRLIAKMSLVGVPSVCLLTDAGLCGVCPAGVWELRAVRRVDV